MSQDLEKSDKKTERRCPGGGRRARDTRACSWEVQIQIKDAIVLQGGGTPRVDLRIRQCQGISDHSESPFIRAIRVGFRETERREPACEDIVPQSFI